MHTSDGNNPLVQEMAKGNESRDPHEDSVNATKDGEIKSSESSKSYRTDPWIRHCIERRDLNNKLKSRYDVPKHDADIFNLGGDSRRGNNIPTFEHVLVFRTKSEGSATDERLPTSGISPTYYLRIYSDAVIQALRSIVRYYPGQDLSGDFIDVAWPYPVLVHHYNELRSFGEVVSKKEAEEVCVRERDAEKHIELLLDFLDKEVMEMVNAEKERNKRGFFTFDYMWVAMKPGTTYLYKLREGEDEWGCGVIYSFIGGIFDHPREHWTLSVWSMAYDGLFLGREKHWLEHQKFDGEKPLISAMFMFLGDMEEFGETKQNEIIGQLIKQGKTYWKLIDKQCMYHEGMTIELPKNEVRIKI
jgi:hypothetical protein